jgi:antiviral helicase SKI2
MSEDLCKALERVQLSADAIDDLDLDSWIENERSAEDQLRGPWVQTQQTPEELKKDLEKEFLTPSTKFNAQWLNRLQRYVYSVFLVRFFIVLF